MIVGGGAAGLLAAIRAGERQRGGVLLVEAAGEVGRKILVSGGGRCNLLPMEAAPERFVSASPTRLVHRFLDRFPLEAQRKFFEELLGGSLREEPEARKLFPPSNRARDVRDALARRAAHAGVRFLVEAPVRDLVRRPQAGWLLRLPDAEVLAGAVLLATGGRSVLARGADAAGLEWAFRLGHTVVDPYPALAPLVAAGTPHAALAGLSVTARVMAWSGEERAEAVSGFLFTHRGYSGPAVLDVAHVVERAVRAGRSFRVTAAFRPSGEEPDWDAAIRQGSGSLSGFLKRRFPDRLAELLRSAAGVPDTPLSGLTREARRRVVSVLTAFELPVSGTEGYRTAEVTGGGVALSEVDPGSCRSKLQPDLFLAGEILDAFGPIGGFNFQWAWATGWTAGGAMAAAAS